MIMAELDLLLTVVSDFPIIDPEPSKITALLARIEVMNTEPLLTHSPPGHSDRATAYHTGDEGDGASQNKTPTKKVITGTGADFLFILFLLFFFFCLTFHR